MNTEPRWPSTDDGASDRSAPDAALGPSAFPDADYEGYPAAGYGAGIAREPAGATPELPGQGPIILAGLAIGIMMMGVQLWLLTVALDLYLGGAGERIWLLALISGAIFLGGLLMLWLLKHRPRVHNPPIFPGGPNGQ